MKVYMSIGNNMKNYKKIMMIPVFCESHLIKYQIDNLMETINPDIIVYNEGMFPHGPESNTDMRGFLEKYTLQGKGLRGFDFPELQEIIFESQKKYKDKKIILNKMSYDFDQQSATQHYIKACTNFKELNIEVNQGDVLFPFEGDVFHHESEKENIQSIINNLEPDTGFKSTWIDFITNQYYADMCTLKPFFKNQKGRYRKIGVKFGTMDFYKNVLQNFESQKYNFLKDVDLITYHYAWFRPNKYLNLRFDQLNRHPDYWRHFNIALSKTSECIYSQILARPSLTGTYKYFSAIDISHPKAIKDHPNFIKEKINIDKVIENNMIYEDII